MFKPINRICALAAGLAVCVSICSCGGISNDAVVQVDGKSITKSTFDHWMKIGLSSQSSGETSTQRALPEPPNYTACIAHLAAIEAKPAKGKKKKTTAELKKQCEQQFKALEPQVLGLLITSDWILGEAQALGIKVSDQEVIKKFNQIRQAHYPQEATFQKFLASSGYTVSDLLLNQKLESLAEKIEGKVKEKASSVTTAQAHAYYEHHQLTYGALEKRNLLLILTKTEAQAKEAKKEVQSGKSFASVAKAKSIDPTTKDKGGVLNEVSKGEEEQALDTAAFSATIGVLSGPIKTPFGYYIFQVTKVVPGNQKTFAQVQSQVKQQLASEQQQTALSNFIKEFHKKWEGKTECRAEYMVPDCKGYKASKVTSTAAPVTAAPQSTATTSTTTSKASIGGKKK